MRQGDIVLIKFPFSDLSELKLRPALVLSNEKYNANRNCILAGIYGTKKPFSLELSNGELRAKKLTKASYISFQNIFSADNSLIGKRVDTVSPDFLRKVLRELKACF
jgi:mRNA interferase MazF